MRGTIVLDEARCKGCELCVSVCPKRLIQLADHFTAHGYRPAVLIDPTGACTGCLLCATVCPEAGITIYRASRSPAVSAPAADMRAAPVSEQGGNP